MSTHERNNNFQNHTQQSCSESTKEPLKTPSQTEPKTWVDVVQEHAKVVDDMEFETPKRSQPRAASH